MIGHSTHWPLIYTLAPCGQYNIKDLTGYFGILIEQLMEITELIE
jgi:hypothetical protein